MEDAEFHLFSQSQASPFQNEKENKKKDFIEML
jgi:hypothetical protein